MRLDIDEQTHLRLLQLNDNVFELTEQNRAYLSEWLPWVNSTQSVIPKPFLICTASCRKEGRVPLRCLRAAAGGLDRLRFNAEAYVTNPLLVECRCKWKRVDDQAVQTLCLC